MTNTTSNTAAIFIAEHRATCSADALAGLLQIAMERPSDDDEGGSARAYLAAKGWGFHPSEAGGFSAHLFGGKPETPNGRAAVLNAEDDLFSVFDGFPTAYLCDMAEQDAQTIWGLSAERRAAMARTALSVAAAAMARYWACTEAQG